MRIVELNAHIILLKLFLDFLEDEEAIKRAT